MLDLEIQGVGTIQVGDEFKSLSPEQQNSFVQNVIGQISGAKQGSNSLIPEAPAPREREFLDRTYFGQAIKGAGQFAMGLPTGLGNLAVGATQAITDILDPKAESGFSKRLAEEVARRKAEQSQLLTPEKAGIFAGEVAPTLPIGAGMGLVRGGLAGGAAASAISPQEEPGLENRLKETATGGATGAVVGSGIKGAAAIAPTVASLPKRLLQKIAGVDPKLAQAFEAAGVSPRLADITEGARTKTFQNLVQNFPGGGKPLEEAAQRQIDDITKQIAGITKSEGGTIQQTGKTIQEGAQNFKGMVQDRVGKLYDDLDKFIPQANEAKVSTGSVQKLAQDPAIQDVVAVGSGDTAKVLRRFDEIVDAEGQISYPRLKTFRSTVGAKLASPSLLGEERGALKRIYGALSEDMKEAVVANGGEKGLQAFNKANNAFARSQAFLEKNIDPLINAKTPEQVYQLALAGTKQGGTNVKKVMTSLNPTQKEFVEGTVLKQMGTASAGAQDATGEVFSPAKFLTEWNKMSPEAKRAIFKPQQVEAVNNLNKAISLIKDSSKAKQTSNNLPYASWAGLGGVTAANPATGLGLVGGARITSSMMANPRFVNWLAKTPGVKQIDIPKHLGMLSVIASKDPDIREDVLDYLGSITVGDANAAEDSKSIEEIKSELQSQKEKYPVIGQGIDVEKDAQKIKQRFYRE